VTLEQIIKRTVALGVPDATIAALSSMSCGTYSKLRNGAVLPTREQMIRIESALAQLEKLTEQASPIPVNFSAVGKLKSLLDEMESGRVIIVTFRESEPVQISSK
jgi:hypothetical protein